jgi:hypothetical protein
MCSPEEVGSVTREILLVEDLFAVVYETTYAVLPVS